MRNSIGSAVFVPLLAALAMAQSALLPAPLPPIRIILVGDSTMAVKNGWGSGFCDLVVPQVSCVNMAKNGRSSSSFRAEGLWAAIMDELKHNANFKATYVFIQFGHNDEPGKPGRSTDLATEFPDNLRRYVKEVKAAGANPVLITSLTRRRFKNGQLENDLAPWADATKRVAAEQRIPVLDLNRDSFAAVQKMGPAEANTLAMEPPPPAIAEAVARGDSPKMPKKPPAATGAAANDTVAAAPASEAVPANNVVEHTGAATTQFDYTHLGAKGAALFGRMVADELRQAVPDLRPYLKPR
jgi:lysophospholipase L1-like esterase